jgi:GT2 family glycosyltransferase/glycosyltransferase involved in cell wall biosynthesis
VNDGSSDETSDKLAEAQGIRTVRNPVAQGFIRACNLGASLAQGELVLFLNNDTEVKPGWLESLLATAMEPDVAIVGSKLVYPNGTLQEAGGIVYNDGSGSNYGRNQDPEDPKYNFVRDVDYCSGASILVKKDFFDKVGGFDELYLPAYYEDTDLCMKARAAGLRVVYQPKSVVIHYEGVTSGTDLTSGTKKYQVINKEKFVERWQEELKAHCPALGYCALDIAARRLIAKPTILFCDVVVPRYDCDSGSLRLYRILNLLKELGYGIIFYSMNYKSVEPYKSKLEEMGIQVVLGSEDEEADRHTVRTWLALSDMVFVSRPETMARVLPVLVQEGTRRIVYDTVDIHYIRLRRQAELGISKPGESDWFDVRVDELRYCRVADVTLTVTETDKQHLELQGISHVAVVPNVQELPSEVRPGYEDREGILFIGMYTHAPNVDAVVWFVREIMPLIWAVKPGLKVTLLGSFPTDEVYALQSDRVEVTGYIEDVEPYFLTHRVFVAPLRYGAGMKGKITQSLYYQLPVVTTSIGAEGMGLVDHENAVVSDLAPDFAEAVLELYENRSLWEHIASNCSEALLPQSPGVIKETLKNVVEGLMRDPKLAD